MILMIDNYDSFTYNIVQYFYELGQDVLVKRNDEITVEDIKRMDNVDAIVISPGPCTPNEAGISVDVIKEFKGVYPILGVCLGHQSIGQAFGAKIVKAKCLMHGKTSKIYHNEKGLFEGIPNPFNAVRYHSLVIDESTLPEDIEITARSDDGEIMAIQHKKYPIWGVQFHPESILTEYGLKLLENFIHLAEKAKTTSKQ
ncbi:anthranilate synthase component II [Sulfurihydrogenibium azorense]|uniref:Para-aminobenzoate/anthranilate synthase glutamine amidotransferasecomponent II n=1 Tax=Sulfurihydrogenibium azorense (strain DSM 15241 / OCM 825 / Az-Fu1) TaxID=204536 RepID=C1DXU3_SULAA|nr:aminodeoxychorismate/anthranilate synthase component II [Sulfurihydrogenibium azorense]ACN98796.1 para-aminobenzoate/anthranilate synthase glutamine amidotransferasecomponent II [Sulfurihydrogenibium azorense Az-Fu1]MDM7273470.1 aminodeoxychorismate/anthranilate synthase component II [Sulfurihydrogenibium azorense]